VLPFRLDTVAKAGEALLIVGLVEDQALRLTRLRSFSEGSTCSGVGRPKPRRLPRGGPDKVQQTKPAEEEGRDEGHEPYDAKE
jgi:hypothetical protein